MTRREELEDRLLQAALEERLGAQPAPDLRDRVLGASAEDRRAAARRADRAQNARGPRVWPRVAAVLAAGVLVVMAVQWLREEDDRQIRPTDVAELRALLAELRAVRITALRSQRHDVLFDPALDRELSLSGTAVDAFARAAIASAGSTAPLPPQLEVAGHRLELAVPGGYLLAALLPGTPARWRVDGLGDLPAKPELSAALQPSFDALDARVRAAQGLVFASAELDAAFGIADDAPALRLFGIDDRGLLGLARFEALQRLDLSGCRKTMGAGLKVIAKLPTLVELDVTGCAVWPLALLTICENSPLRTLDLTDTRLFLPSPTTAKSKGKEFKAIAIATRTLAERGTLTDLRLARSQLATPEMLRNLLDASALRRLDLTSCDVDATLLAKLKARLPQCEILH